MRRRPPDILITTPESLYLILTSQAREMLERVQWAIVDEIHAVAVDEARQPHRTDARAPGAPLGEYQRIGLSATQNPLEEVGRFLVGPRRTCTIVDAGVRKPLDLQIQVPVESMVEPEQSTGELDPLEPVVGGEATRRSIWPAIYPQVLDHVLRAPLDDRLRQQPPHGRAPRPAPERAGQRGPSRRGAVPGDRPRPPRLAGARGAHGRGGAAEGGRPAVPRRDLLAGARHRHGRGRPRPADRVAEVGRAGPAAHRPRRPLRRRHLQGPDLPQVPRRPARVRGRREAHARGAHRADRRAAQRARRPGPADRRDRRLVGG